MDDKDVPEGDSITIKVQYVCGFPFPANFITKENILSAINYNPHDDDIIISSYPKTGTTWVQYIVFQILHRSEFFPSFHDLSYKVAPYMELVGAKAAEELQPPRFLKFHLPYDLIPKSKTAKYIYTVRNPKDTAVSLYYFGIEMGIHTMKFHDYFSYFMKGEIGYGDYFEHVTSWYDHKDEENILLVCYEELCRDVKTQVLRIAEFLGPSHLRALQEDSALLERVISNTSYRHMKENLFVKIPTRGVKEQEEKCVNFFRKGVPGDWRNHLSDEQSRLLDEKIQTKLKNTKLISLWRNIV